MALRELVRLGALVAVTLIAAAGFGNFSAHEVGAVPGSGTLVGTDAADTNLITVNPNTGAGAVVGSMGFAAPSLAIDPATGAIYAGQGGGSPIIYTVEKGTGVATLLGDSGLGFAAVGGMDFRSDGTLFAAVNVAGDGGTGSDHLATINITTGEAAVIGPFGTCTGVLTPTAGSGSCTIEGIEGIAFDESGTLWGSHSARGAAGAPGLYTINPDTGAATFVAPIDNGVGAPSGGVVSLQFACNGTLYGGSASALSPATDGGFLGTIDTGTGLWTFVGAASATGGRSLGGLGFQGPCAVGGIAVDPDLSALALEAPEPAGGNAGLLAGIVAAVVAGVVALGGGALGAARYARRRVIS